MVDRANSRPGREAGDLNRRWAEALIGELVSCGVRHAVVCPGSRSTPLALACADHPGLKVWSILDERSAAFFALGLAKQAEVPPLLVCTSGTAGAHFYPAVIEASLGRVPLLVLTADRPWELQGFGAAQTIDQHGLFGRYARFFAELTEPIEDPRGLLHLRALAARAVAIAGGAPRGVAHLNVPFREPLVALPREVSESPPVAPSSMRVVQPSLAPDARMLAELRERLDGTERGLIVCGPRERDDGLAEAVVRLGAALGYPVLAEAASGVRYQPERDGVVTCYDALLRHPGFAKAYRPSVVLRFGAGLTSKGLQTFLDTSGAFTVVFSEDGSLCDPAHAAAAVVVGDPVQSCVALSAPRSGARAYRASFVEAERKAQGALEAAFCASGELTEPRIAREVVSVLPPGAHLFLSSSMPIRDADAFAPTSSGRLRVFANRGANGIDGIISSALGVAAGASAPTVLLTGDLALLHDLGGLVAAGRLGLSLIVVVVNNAGGGIFHFLPVAELFDRYEALFATPHAVDLRVVAELSGARLWRPSGVEELRSAVRSGTEGGLHLIEVRTDRVENVQAHRALFAAVAQALGEGPWA